MPSRKEILEKIDMAQLLEDIGFDNVNPMKDTYLGYCVFHDDSNTKSFSANFTAKLFKCFGCVRGDSYVLTSEGTKRVDIVRIGDYILGRNGRYVRVNAVNITQKSERRCFYYANRNVPLEVTGEHRMLVLRGQNKYGRNYYKGLYGEEIEECLARDVRVGDFMLSPKPLLRDIKKWDISRYVVERETKVRSGFRAKGIPHILEVDDDLLWLIGLYVAEGSSSCAGRVVFFSLNRKEVAYANRVVKIIKDKFGLDAVIDLRKDRPNSLEVRICNAYLADVFSGACGKGAASKHIPHELLYVANFSLLQGYFDGDGHRTQRGYRSVATISMELAWQFYMSMIAFNMYPRMYRSKAFVDRKGIHHKIVYNVHFSLRGKRAFFWKNYYCTQVDHIEVCQGSGDVFDFSVEDSWFVVDGIVVHNCNIHGNALQLYSKWKNISEEAAMVELDQLTTPRSLDSLDRQLHIIEIIPIWKKFELLTAYVNKQPLLTTTLLKRYLNDRGITDKTLDHFGIRAWSPTRFEEHELSNYQSLGVIGQRNETIYEKFALHPILFPYWDGSHSTVTFIQGRMVENRVDLPKYTGVKAAITHAFNHGILYHTTDTVYVCEGVIDTLSMVELGYYNSIGIVGVNSFKSAWLDDFHCRKVVLALDNDVAGGGGCKMLTELFSRRGLEVVRFQDHVGHKDVNEFLQKIRGGPIKS